MQATLLERLVERYAPDDIKSRIRVIRHLEDESRKARLAVKEQTESLLDHVGMNPNAERRFYKGQERNHMNGLPIDREPLLAS